MKWCVWAGCVVYVHAHVHKADRTQCSVRRHWGFTRTLSWVHSVVRAHIDACVFCTAPPNVVWTIMRLVCRLRCIHLADIFVYRDFTISVWNGGWSWLGKNKSSVDGFHSCYLWGFSPKNNADSGLTEQHRFPAQHDVCAASCLSIKTERRSSVSSSFNSHRCKSSRMR